MAGVVTNAPVAGALRVVLAPAHANTVDPIVVEPADVTSPSGAAPSGWAALEVEPTPGRVALPIVDGRPTEAVLAVQGGGRATLTIGTQGHDVLLALLPDPGRAATGVTRFEVVLDGWRFEVDVEADARARLRERATTTRGDAARGGPVELRAIIPGRVVSVEVAAGDTVDAGGRLLVVEAMKMQNELRAPRGGTIGRVAVAPGQTVELGELLLVIE